MSEVSFKAYHCCKFLFSWNYVTYIIFKDLAQLQKQNTHEVISSWVQVFKFSPSPEGTNLATTWFWTFHLFQRINAGHVAVVLSSPLWQIAVTALDNRYTPWSPTGIFFFSKSIYLWFHMWKFFYFWEGDDEDEMAGWHHQLDVREFEWTPGVGGGQGGLASCNSWGRKESDTTEWLNWTDWTWPQHRHDSLSFGQITPLHPSI